MNQTESIKAYLEEKASKHKIAYTDIDKYQELIEGYFDYINQKNKSCFNCKFRMKIGHDACLTCFKDISKPNWQKV